MKITKEEFNKLYSDNITKKEYDLIISKIDERFSEIISLLITTKVEDFSWFDYGNCDEGNGYFDKTEHKENISIHISNGSLEHPYNERIPTRWLWEENYKKEYETEVLKYKNEEKAKKLKNKQRREEIKRKKGKFKEIIQSKLTKEELSYIKFK